MSNKLLALLYVKSDVWRSSFDVRFSLKAGVIALLLSFAALPVAAESAPAAIALLEQMASSFRTLNYDGVYVHQNGKAVDSARIVHVVVDGKEHERLLQLTGAEQEIVRSGHDANCIHPGDERLRSIDSHSIQASGGHVFGSYKLQPSKILPHYRVRPLGKDRVAGRAVHIVQVKPLDQERYEYQLYLDQETGLLMKSVTLNAQSQALESFQFTQINIGADVDVNAVKPTSDAVQRTDYHAVKQLKPSTAMPELVSWRTNWLPDGFLMVASGGKMQATEAMHTFLYTDGLASVSVFIEAAETSANTDQALSPQQTRLGSTIAYVMPRRLANKTFLVSVIGNVPDATAQRIAQNVAVVAGDE